MKSIILFITVLVILLGLCNCNSIKIKDESNSSEEQKPCIIFISKESKNENITCGAENDPCPNLYEGMRSCENSNQVYNMSFYFGAGTFTIQNGVYRLTIYNQHVSIYGDIHGGTILNFANPDKTILVFQEPENPSSEVVTSFQMMNLNFQDLSQTFIKAQLTNSSGQVTISDCTFTTIKKLVQNPYFNISSNLSFIFTITDSVFNQTETSVNNTLPLIYNGQGMISTFTNIKFINCISTNSMILSRNDIFSMDSCEFSNNIANGNEKALLSFHSLAHEFDMNSNSFINNTGSSSLMFFAESPLISISESSFENNSLVLFDLEKVDEMSLFSNCNFTSNTATVLKLNQSTGEFNSCNFINNNVVDSLIYATGSKVIVESCLFTMNNGSITDITNNSTGDFQNNLIGQGNDNFKLFICSNDTNITFQTANNITFSELMISDEVSCDTSCLVNGQNGCNSDSNANSPLVSNQHQIIVGSITACVAVFMILGIVIYFKRFHYYNKHPYTRIN